MLTWEVDDSAPVAGRHYPRDLAEFNRWFRTEASAAKYLTDVRFRHGFACPLGMSSQFGPSVIT